MDINLRNNLINLGFGQGEIQAYEYIYMNGGKFTPNALMSYGYNYEQARRLAYMNKAVQGGVQINTENDMIAHYKKMTGANRQDAKVAVYAQNLQNGYAQNYSDTELVKHLKQTAGITRKITIQDLAVSNVSEVPRVAVISGITQEPFTIWNSSNYKGTQALYRVVDVSGQKVTVETGKKPVLKYGANKVVPGVLELKGVKQNGNAVVVFDKKVCRLCNRFVIVASLKRPEFHLGCYDIICFEGTRVYVYASNMGTRDQVRYKGGTQRVYAYGIFPGDIKGKLDNEAKKIYGNLNGVKAQYQSANEDYRVVPTEQNDSIEEEEAVDF
jgi:predicted ribosome-associated RNA-binding protein Tma20